MPFESMREGLGETLRTGEVKFRELTLRETEALNNALEKLWTSAAASQRIEGQEIEMGESRPNVELSVEEKYTLAKTLGIVSE